jgi:hypothetical protein
MAKERVRITQRRREEGVLRRRGRKSRAGSLRMAECLSSLRAGLGLEDKAREERGR